MNSNNSEGFLSVSEIINIFRQNIRFILIFTISAFILFFILYFFVIKPVYLSTSLIKSSESSKGINSIISNSIPDLGDLEDLTGGGSSGQELSLFEKILLSRRCLEETIVKFNLMEDYDIKYMKFALKIMREEIIEISKDKISGTMSLGVFDEDAAKAKDINEFLLFQLNKINTELSVLEAKNKREFLEGRYIIVQQDLRSVEDSLIYFQNTFGISPDITIQAAVKAELELDAEIKSEEVKLEILRTILSPEEAEIKTQMEKLKLLNEQLTDLRNNEFKQGDLGLNGSPEVVMDFLRLKRKVETQNRILSIILPLFEQAKIEENRKTPNILIIDNPEIPDYKDKPKRATKILGYTFAIFVLSFSYFIIKYKWVQYKNRLSK